jgi:hypothetical protein
VKQDILILPGAEVHFIPIKMHNKQVHALRNAKSVTARIFTKEDQAQNHCKTGNLGLAPDVKEKWMKEKTGLKPFFSSMCSFLCEMQYSTFHESGNNISGIFPHHVRRNAL